MTKPSNDCATSEDSDQPWHPPSLIRVFAVPKKKAYLPTESTAKTLISLGDAKADLSLRWGHSHFVGFVMRRLKSKHNVFCFYKMLINAVAAQEHMS